VAGSVQGDAGQDDPLIPQGQGDHDGEEPRGPGARTFDIPNVVRLFVAWPGPSVGVSFDASLVALVGAPESPPKLRLLGVK
jgi:hypothetical protein